MSQMTRSRKILLGLAVVVVAVVGYTQFVPQDTGTSAPSSTPEQDRSVIATLNEQIAQAEAAMSDSDAFARELATARQAVPPTPALGPVITSLEELARTAGLTWVLGAPTRSSTDAAGTWGMEMKVTGTPGGVVSYLDAIQSMSRLVTVHGVTMQIPGGTTAEANITVRFYSTPGDLEAFPEAERAAIEQALQTLPTPDGTSPEASDGASAQEGAE